MKTERLKLRRFSPEDFPAFAELVRDKMRSPLSAYDSQFPTDDEGLREVLSFLSDGDCYFAVILKAEKRLIGFVSLSEAGQYTRNIGYFIHSEYQGKGYGTEAVAAAIDYAKTRLKARRLTAQTAEANTPSVRLLAHSGFVRTGGGMASFTADKNGNPIRFASLSFERIL